MGAILSLGQDDSAAPATAASASRKTGFEQLRCAPAACVLVDSLGRILDCNNAASTRFMRSSDSLAGISAVTLIVPDDEPLFLSALHQVLNTGYSDTIAVHVMGDRRVKLSLHCVEWNEEHHRCCLVTIASDSHRLESPASEQVPISRDRIARNRPPSAQIICAA